MIAINVSVAICQFPIFLIWKKVYYLIPDKYLIHFYTELPYLGLGLKKLVYRLIVPLHGNL